ncbi:MAG: anthranilate synthase [Bacteroidetes bacterium OLB11]|nr:MAG: anthranilate synthase [Bacteroidetes bacterium OLB11]
MKQPLLVEPENLSQQNIFIDFPAFSNLSHPLSNNDFISIKSKTPIQRSLYQKGFDVVKKNLMYGNSFLTNYTCETEIEILHSLYSIFENAHAKYKIFFKDEWVCFSPETFIKIEGNEIFSFPMKGTINAAIPNAETIILNDEKEKAEHYTIVDLIRNDLSMVSTNVVVENFRFIDKIETQNGALLQVSSKIKGILSKDFYSHLGEILFELLPAGSISGAPKNKTIEIIHQAENYQRGFYTGVAFYFDGYQIDSCVLIRFIEKKGKQLFYKSGGGITIHSILEKEYQEMIDKIYVPIH